MSDNRLIRLAVAGLLALSVAACGNIKVPTPTRETSGGAANALCNAETGRDDTVRVCPGDSLIALSYRYDVTVRGLMLANGLSDDRIFAGQILTLPQEFVHAVAPGETVTSIVRRYRVSDSALIAANEMRPPYTIFPEQRLAIPSDRAGTALRPTVREVPPDTVGEPPPSEIGPSSPPIAVVTPKVALETTAVPTTVATEPQAGAVTPGPLPRQRPMAGKPQQHAGSSSSAQSPTSPAPTVQAESQSQKPDTPTRAQDAAFLIPVQGRIVSDYGPKSGGLHNDGINIAAPRGTPIVATADGDVAYAGDGLPGFGNLILIRHAGGWTSAYAHADSVSVKRGDKVKRGERIGSVGSTGSVTKPQLHFELRKHDRAIDPKPRLSS